VPPSSDPLGSEAEHWRAIRDSRNPSDFMDYLARYGPDGAFSEVAELRLKQLTGPGDARMPSTPPRPAVRPPPPAPRAPSPAGSILAAAWEIRRSGKNRPPSKARRRRQATQTSSRKSKKRQACRCRKR
jgi:hypothetical protein